MQLKNILLVSVSVALLAGCSSEEKIPVAGQGGTPPPFKAKIDAGMAKRGSAAAAQGQHPGGGATATN